MKRTTIFNFPITLGKYQDFINNIIESAKAGSGKYIYVANVHMLIEACRNKSFLDQAHRAFIITPDGKPITWALRLLNGIKQDRVAGMDLLPALFAKAEEAQLPVYIYGGTIALLDQTIKYLKNNYPDLVVTGTYSPPFKTLTPEEELDVVNRINSASPQLAFIVLGCPKQEKWMAAMQGRINAVMIGIGGALPVMIGAKKRAPEWMQNAGLEWFFRLCLEPHRLFKRYAVTNSFFLYLLGKELVKKKILKYEDKL